MSMERPPVHPYFFPSLVAKHLSPSSEHCAGSEARPGHWGTALHLTGLEACTLMPAKPADHWLARTLRQYCM